MLTSTWGDFRNMYIQSFCPIIECSQTTGLVAKVYGCIAELMWRAVSGLAVFG